MKKNQTLVDISHFYMLTESDFRKIIKGNKSGFQKYCYITSASLSNI